MINAIGSIYISGCFDYCCNLIYTFLQRAIPSIPTGSKLCIQSRLSHAAHIKAAAPKVSLVQLGEVTSGSSLESTLDLLHGVGLMLIVGVGMLVNRLAFQLNLQGPKR